MIAKKYLYVEIKPLGSVLELSDVNHQKSKAIISYRFHATQTATSPLL